MGDILDAVGRLVTTLIGYFGPWGTISLFGVALVGLGIRKVYYDRRADRDRNEALAEKERTIQRLASDVREWKMYAFMKGHGMTLQEAERLFSANDFPDPESARAALESRPQPKRVPPPKGPPPKERS